MESIDKKALFKLNVDEFDEDEALKGWRLLAEKLKKNKEAAELIKEYIQVTGRAKPNLIFHIGQCYASEGEEYYLEAIKYFEESLNEMPGRPIMPAVMIYRRLSIAYMKSELDVMRECLAELNNLGASENLERVGAHMLEWLEKDGKPNYAKMYDAL